ncbi:tripartite tricarboxylate transporter substrate binding protein [soil metagenome]
MSHPPAACNYPNNPVRLRVPFPAGSAIDTIARAVTEKMAPTLGKPIVVEPMPGGGSVLATQFGIRQPNDGYTLLVVTNSAAIKSSLPKPPFDVRKDLTLVGQFSASPLFLAVNKDLPVNSVQELIAYAAANPGKLNMSSYGMGTLGHLAGELFLQRTGVKMVHVPYPGSVQNGQALASGATHVTFDVLNSLRPHQQRGAIKFLAVTTATRSTDVPELPTLLESGVSGIDIETFGGLAAPAGTPKDIIDKLNAALNVSLKDPATIDFFERTGFGVVRGGTTPSRFTEKVNGSVDVFSKLIRDTNLDVE